MNADLFQGKLVRLVASSPEETAKLFSRWNRNSLYARLLDDQPQIPSQVKMKSSGGVISSKETNTIMAVNASPQLFSIVATCRAPSGEEVEAQGLYLRGAAQ